MEHRINKGRWETVSLVTAGLEMSKLGNQWSGYKRASEQVVISML